MKKIIILLLAFLCYNGKSQIAIDSNYFYLDTATSLYMPKQKVHISEIFTNNLNVFKTIPTYSYQKGHEFALDGLKYTRYDQYIGGVKINGNSYIISSKSDTILNIGGKVVSNAIPILGTVVSTLTAIQSLTNVLSSYKYKWQDSLWEANIKDTKSDTLATYYPKIQLGIFKTLSNDFNNVSDYYYAYPIYISALKSSQDSIYYDSLYYVSAIDGSIIKRFSTYQANEKNVINNNLIKHQSNLLINDAVINEKNQSLNLAANSCNNSCNSTNVTIHYYGGQSINTSEFKYIGICNNRLKNNCTGSTIYTKKQGNSGSVDYRSTNNNWPNQNDKVGITGHWCLEKVYEAYNSLFGINSYNNGYAQLEMLINSSLFGSFWDRGTSIINVGRFQGTNSLQAVLDIVGHEFGHGVMNNSSGVGSNTPDATNLTTFNLSADEDIVAEGFGDIFGQMVEYYVNSNYSTTGAINDFIHGGNNPNGITAGQTRSLINPSQTNNPNTVFGSNWGNTLTTFNQNNYEALIHQNATIVSHWFYLLAQGGTGTNDAPFSNNYCVKPLGQLKAGKIAYLAATHFISNYTKNINGARLACIAAATQLYGANSDEVAQTTEAWYAVGVGSKYTGQINTNNLNITAPTTNYHYNAKISMQNVTLANTGALDVSSNTEIELLPDINFNQGAIADLYIAPPNPCSAGAREINPNNGNTSNNQNTFDENNTTALKNQIQNQKELAFNIIPNPNNGNFNLTLNNNNELPKSIIICNAQGKEVKTITNPTEYEYTFNLNQLSSGLYIINAFYNDKSISKRFIKN